MRDFITPKTKPLKIRNKSMDNKISRTNSFNKKVRGWVELDFPVPLKSLPTG